MGTFTDRHGYRRAAGGGGVPTTQTRGKFATARRELPANLVLDMAPPENNWDDCLKLDVAYGASDFNIEQPPGTNLSVTVAPSPSGDRIKVQIERDLDVRNGISSYLVENNELGLNSVRLSELRFADEPVSDLLYEDESDLIDSWLDQNREHIRSFISQNYGGHIQSRDGWTLSSGCVLDLSFDVDSKSNTPGIRQHIANEVSTRLSSSDGDDFYRQMYQHVKGAQRNQEVIDALEKIAYDSPDSLDLYDLALQHGDKRVHLAVANHPLADSRSLDHVWSRHSDDEEVLIAIAKHPQADRSLLNIIAGERDFPYAALQAREHPSFLARQGEDM